MRKSSRLFSAFPLLLLLTLLLSTHDNSPIVLEKGFIIDGNSELSLRGASNVNNFTCLCLCVEKNQLHPFQLTTRPGSRLLEFTGTGLQLTASALDCGNKGMNNDMYRTLKADKYPNISIELLRAQEAGATLANTKEWADVKVVLAITIAGVRREVPMNVRGQNLGPSKFHFVGSRDLLMSDYELTPPKPMMGLIKVKDKITINLDLIIRLVEQ